MELYSEEQIQMVQYIIDSMKSYGTLDLEDMKDPEFFGGLDIVENWSHKDALEKWIILQNAITQINKNAEKQAA